MGAAVVSCCDPSPVLEPAKHVFNLMPLFIQGFGVSGRKIAPLSRWDTGGYSPGFKRGSEFITVIALVANQARGTFGQGWINQFCPNMITHLTFAQTQDDRAAFVVTHGMEFGVQTSLCASNTAGNIPFFNRLLAVRCAFR